MERRLALPFLFAAPFFATFVLRQIHWSQELIANVWWIGIIAALILLRISIGALITGRRWIVGTGGILTAMLTLSKILTPLAFYSPLYKHPQLINQQSVTFRYAGDARLADGRFAAAVSDLVISPTSMKVQSAQLRIESLGADSMGEGALPLASYRVHIPQCQPLDLYIVNFSGPLTQSDYFRRRMTLRRLSTLLRHSRAPAAIIGDLGSGPFGRLYGSFLAAARVSDARWGRWPGVLQWRTDPPQLSFVSAATKEPAVIADLQVDEGKRALSGTIQIAGCAPRA